MTTWQISNLYDQSLELVEGRGVAKDFEKAFALNAQAARLGHHDAILAMGWFYLNGVGVTRDVDEIISSSGPKEGTRGKAGFEILDIRPRHSPPHGIH